MACIKFNIDKLAGKLINATATELEKLAAKAAKELQIVETFAQAANDIKNLANNAVENFKKITTGELPNLSDIADQAFSKITNELDRALNDVENLAKIIGEELNGLESFISEQIDCITNAKNKSTELASIQGGLKSSMSKGIKKLSNNQLRDFNIQTPEFDGAKLQSQIADGIAQSSIDIQATKAALGKSFSQQAQTQAKTIDKFSELNVNFAKSAEVAPPNINTDAFEKLIDPDTNELVGYIDRSTEQILDENFAVLS